mmetsp:Transcript_31949/g.85564  ORF Transcript_31949/g.85564 Transcript_31949/m.85564 type:complete len:232 (+) Transcript_31949:348-1043(+)
MQVVHEPQSASPRTADLHSAEMVSSRVVGQGREKVGFMYLRVSTRTARNFASTTSSASEPRPLLMSSNATGPSMTPVRLANFNTVEGPKSVGLSTSPPPTTSVRGASRAAGRGSTPTVTGVDILYVAWPGPPAPNPGMKHENFPASEPATTIWKESTLLNFGILVEPSTLATHQAKRPRRRHTMRGARGKRLSNSPVRSRGNCLTMWPHVLLQRHVASFLLESMPALSSVS